MDLCPDTVFLVAKSRLDSLHCHGECFLFSLHAIPLCNKRCPVLSLAVR